MLEFLPISIVAALKDEINLIFCIVIIILFASGIFFCFSNKFLNFKEFIPSLCSSRYCPEFFALLGAAQ